MTGRLAVPTDRMEAIRAFVTSQGIPIQVVAAGQMHEPGARTVQVISAAAGTQSSSATLQAGGWIACATAFKAARQLGITPAQLGKLLDHLDIRIRACQLGCFE